MYQNTFTSQLHCFIESESNPNLTLTKLTVATHFNDHEWNVELGI